MQRRVLAVFALVLVVTVGFVVWRSLARASEPAVVAEDRPASKFDAPSAAAAPTLARASEPERTSDKSAAPTPLAVETAVPDQRTVAAQGGIEFKLDVTWPEDVPADEEAELVVQGRLTTDIVARLPLTRGGEYTVYLPKEETKGRVVVEARYLYLDDAVKLDPLRRSKRLECTPQVGAWLHGRVTFPAGVADEDRELEKARVLRRGVRLKSGEIVFASAELDSDHARIAPDGAYSLGGLSPAMQHSVSLELPAFVKHEKRFENVEAGKTIEYDIPIELGVSFFGRVVDAGGAPVAKARVTCALDESGWRHAAERSAESGADGRFALRGLEPKRMTLHVSHQGFVDYSGERREFAAGDVLRDLVVTLERGNVLAGTVKWADGRPADGATLRAVDLSGSDDDEMWSPTGEAPDGKADVQGAFEISGLGAGPFELRASATQIVKGEGRKKDRKPWRAILDSVDANSRDLVLVLEPPRALVGTVRDDLGQPVPKFTVTATPLDLEGQARWTSRVSQLARDEKGNFRLEKVHPGTWEVQVDALGYEESEEQRVVVEDGEVVVDFVCPRAIVLSGLVLDPYGKPIAGAAMHISADGNENYWSRSGCTTDAQGAFTCKDQRPGKLHVWASHASYAESEQRELEVAPGAALAGLTFQLRLGGRVEVDVLTSPGVAKAEQNVNLTLADGTNRVHQSEETNDEGRATFEHVSPGEYRVYVWRSDGSSDSGKVEAFEGRTSNVVLGRSTGVTIKVTGHVTAGGEPLEGVNVGFHSAEPSETSGQRWTRTDSDGGYEVVLDQPGKWSATYHDGGSSETFELDIPNAPTFVHDVVLGTASVAGTVFDPAGRPVASVSVALLHDGGEKDGNHAGWVQSDGKGRYEFRHASAGRFRVRAEDSDGTSGLALGKHAAFDLAAGQKLTGIDIVMTAGAELDVRVVGDRGTAGVWVQVAELDGSSLESQQLDATSDRVAFANLPARRVRAMAWGTGVRSAWVEVDLVAGSKRAVEVELVASAKATLHLVDASGNAINGHATLTGAALSEPLDYGGDARAEHVFQSLSPGTYHALATTEDGAKGELDFELGAGETKTVEVRLQK